MQCDHGRVFSFFLSDTLRHVPAGQPPRMVRAVCTVPTLCHATHFGLLCSLCAVLNTSVLCFVVCQAEVVAGKGQEPVETQMGRMVRIGKGGPDQTKIQWLLHVRPGKDW